MKSNFRSKVKEQQIEKLERQTSMLHDKTKINIYLTSDVQLWTGVR